MTPTRTSSVTAQSPAETFTPRSCRAGLPHAAQLALGRFLLGDGGRGLGRRGRGVLLGLRPLRVGPGHLAGLFAEAGLRDIAETTLAARSEYATFDDWWSPFGGGVGSSGAYVRRLEPQLRAAIREACRERLGDGPIVVESVAWACRGTS